MKRLFLLVCIAVLSAAAVGCGQQAPKNTAPSVWTADYAGQSGAADGGKVSTPEPLGGLGVGDHRHPRGHTPSSSTWARGRPK